MVDSSSTPSILLLDKKQDESSMANCDDCKIENAANTSSQEAWSSSDENSSGNEYSVRLKGHHSDNDDDILNKLKKKHKKHKKRKKRHKNKHRQSSSDEDGSSDGKTKASEVGVDLMMTDKRKKEIIMNKISEILEEEENKMECSQNSLTGSIKSAVTEEQSSANKKRSRSKSSDNLFLSLTT